MSRMVRLRAEIQMEGFSNRDMHIHEERHRSTKGWHLLSPPLPCSGLWGKTLRLESIICP